MSTAIITTLLGAAPVQAFEREHGALAKARYGKAEIFKAKGQAIADPTVAGERKTRERLGRKVVWPAALSAEVALPAVGKPATRAAGSPVALSQPVAVVPPKGASAPGARQAARKPAPAPSKARVTVLDRAKTAKLGIQGVVLTVGRADGKTDPADVSVSVDYSGFAHAFGGNWSRRLRMVQLPACALTSPEKPACRTTSPVPTQNSTTLQKATAQVSTGKAVKGTSALSVVALSADTNSDQGTYEATPLSPSSTWTAGGSNGDFTWSYPLDTVPAAAGPQPKLSINYSAQSVDGRTSSTSSQSSWVGDGWDLSTSYVERSYTTCDDDGQDKKYDRCWDEENASIVLNGKSSALIKDKTTGKWHLQGDDAERVTLDTDAVNGDDGDAATEKTKGDKGEHWTVTSPDGTQYVFGKNRLPGWTEGKPETNSVWTVPVFGDDSGEPGYSAASSFSGRWKNQAWRWNLDYVVDPHGNVMTYWYEKETNHYAKAGTTGNGTEYVRGGYLKRIDYGQRSDAVFSTTKPAGARVKFTVAERCVPVEDKEPCTSMTLTNHTAWPDVPFDQICKKDTPCTDQSSPSFFTTKRLTKVTTEVFDGSGTGADSDYPDVNGWTLDQKFPATGDGADPPMWLKSIQRTGKRGTDLAMDPITFSGVQMANRVDKTNDDVPAFIKWRVRTVTSETGSVLTVTYGDPECIADTNVPALTELDKNAKRCYPVKWIPPSNPTPGTNPQPRTDFFHKYNVRQVTESDPTGGAPLKQTDYTYHNGGAWAYDDQSPITEDKYRTWSIWRGYGKVTTTTGEAAGTRSRQVTTYYRGMDGDKQLAPDTTRKATVTDSTGAVVTDEDQFAGQVREQITYNGTTGSEVSGTINTPWSKVTATATHEGRTLNAYFVRPGKEVKRTATPTGATTSTTVSTYDDKTGLVTSVETDAAGKKECERTEYAANETSWMVNYVKRVEKVSVGCDATVNRTGDPKTTHVLSDLRTLYDSGAWGKAPTEGDATSVQRVTGYSGTTPVLQTTTKTSYDSLGRALDIWDTNGVRMKHTEYTPADSGPLTQTKVSNALGHTVTTVIDPAWGLNLSQTDPNGNRTELAYDGLGRLTKVWLADRDRAAGQTPSSTFEYNLSKTKASSVANKSLNNDGTTYQTTYNLYDALLRPRQTQAPGVGGGRVVSETTYDSRGLAVETAAGYIDTTAPSGDLATLITASPAGTQTVFDGAGRPAQEITLVRGARYGVTNHTYQGNVTTVEPPAGAAAIREEVDARGRLIEKREYAGNTADNSYTALKYTYDQADQLVRVEDSNGNAWKYEYDFLGRKTSSTDPDAGKSASEYDNRDQVVVTKDPRGQILSLTYDELGRPTGRLSGRIPVVNGTPTIDESKYLARWSYDTVKLGRPTSTIRYVGGKSGKIYATTNAAYDKLYRVLKEQYTVSTTEGSLAGNGTYTVQNAYNLDGTLQTRTIPAMGGLATETLSYGYNEQRLPTTLEGLTGLVQNTDYLPAGEPIRTTLGVSSAAKWTDINRTYEDGTKRLARQTVTSETHSGTDADVHYAYDIAGNPVSVEDKATTPVDRQCFTYDGNRRLKSAWSATANCTTAPATGNVGGPAPYWKTYTYDSAGNRKTATDHLAAGGAATTTYAHDHKTGTLPRPHLLSATTTTPASASRPNTSYTYDAAGNTVTRTTGTKTQTLLWDEENRLTKVTEADKTETSFLDDAEGNRLIRRDSTGTTLYLGETELRLDNESGQVEATRYYSHNGSVVAMRTPAALTWMSSDHNGTGTLQIDAATQAITRRYSQPFGETRGKPAADWAGEKGFVGGTEDPTGLTHLGVRDYDPAIGRFTSADPIADLKDPQQINGYAYSNNNPVTFADPNGKFWDTIIQIVVAVVSVVTTIVGGTRGGGTIRYTSSGSGNHGSTSSGNSCTTWTIHCSTEPSNPKAEGKWTDFVVSAIAEVARGGAGAADVANNVNPLKWLSCIASPKCANPTSDALDSLISSSGLENDTKANDSGKIAGFVATLFGGEAGVAAKGLVKGAKKGGSWLSRLFGRCKCFPSGTPVLLADGATKSIEKIKVGDEVLAEDPETGEKGSRRVLKLIVTESDKHFNELTVDTPGGPEELTATVEHPFWSPSEAEWVDAGNLKPGMTLRTSTGSTVTVKVNRPYTQHARTYNFTVDDLHTYYVLAGATPVLVHNSNCDVPSGSLSGRKLADKLRNESAGSPFTESGELTPDAIANSRLIMRGSDMGNKALRARFEERGGAAQWGKYSSETHQSPYGDYQVHYYMNRTSGEVMYDFDYKAVMNRR
ncbi:hypothetical protein LG634_08750 [Streptomyces bambusae]|uniref:polymorphic toxin-type HINT domain-containing protein n=1 Tax=Streptomyces bambusae TaxID=1550616 RepID=UPI001CFD45B4|nr:polymorphic toxin-type HINT domain-containing protein [Streptomyces bambusae]MCB5164916.1 hypothetical protein [Streptomyces bambusae]